METTLYDDDPSFIIHKDSINSIKRNMTLDLASPKAFKKQRFNCLLSSPDLNMLKLASPELEKLIIAQNGLVTTTPTPTQFLFPRPATEEQEVYARGFTDALAELQTVNPNQGYGQSLVAAVSSAMLGDSMSINNISSSVAPLSASPPVCHQDLLGNIPTSSASYPISSSTSSSSASSSPFIPLPIKDEPQTVPSMANSPPMSPINMENQEKIKLERKRQRNRLAASKCRKRKLERIAKLEDKVRHMKGENSELSNVVTKLKDQVCVLKQEVMRHSRSGCQIMATDIISSHI